MDIELSAPDHITADFVGEPGQRTFYVQARESEQTVSVLVEKQQVAGVAQLLGRLLGEVNASPPAVWDIAAMRLEQPLTPRWRAGAVAVGLEPELGRFVIELTEFLAEDEAAAEVEPEKVRIWLTEEQAARLAAHAHWAVEQGRPTCRICGLPMDDPDEHLCPRSNGDARAL